MKSFVKPEKDSLLRTVRIIFTDPDATDDSSSSSDEWLPKPRKVKRFVHEITFLSQVSESSQDRSNAIKTPRNKSTRHPVGVRPRPSGKFAAEIMNPFTKTKKWLGTYETPAEAEKAYVDKKVEYDALASSGSAVSSSVVSVTSQCLRSPASASVSCVSADDLSKEKSTLNKDVAASSDDSTKEVFTTFDFSDLKIPDLRFLAAEEDSMISDANGAELDFDCFLSAECNLLLDDYSLLDNGFNISGFENSLPSELPDCDFTEMERELDDFKFAYADQLTTPPLEFGCV
ncbi:unnamed protein product [Arabidopsis halleri]